MALTHAQRIPGATYRFQLNAQFTFEDLERLVPYLHDLGITDCYCSPIFSSSPGSTHGYDVSDYRTINPELGGKQGFDHLVTQLKERDMGVLLDFVPNHMGIGGPFNPWWNDVLECGEQSPYAQFFDIHWNQHHRRKALRILVPMLEDHYGRVLEQGKLALLYGNGAFSIAYGETHFPLSPVSYAIILEPIVRDPACPAEAREELARLVVAYQQPLQMEVGANPRHASCGGESLRNLKRRLVALTEAQPMVRDLIDARLRQLNGVPGQKESFDELDALLEEQHYRLARWQTGAHETNYRRFFAVDTLVGLRMEKPEVFAESHRVLSRLVQERKVTGLRIDHIDGLWDPAQYLERLQSLAPNEADGPLFVVVEKILERSESLPERWRTHGTTGYEFAAEVGWLLTDAAAERRFSEIYSSFTGEKRRYADVIYDKKRLILEEMFANAINNLGRLVDEIVSADRLWRDLTRHELTVAVREIIAGLSVYRTYRRLDEDRSAEDAQAVSEACLRAIQRNPRLNPQPFTFVRDLLIGDYPPPGSHPDYQARLVDWILTFQQYTGAVMAKSVEDTAFYVYNRLIPLNEVGGNPSVFGVTIPEFHAANQARARTAPHALLSTSTHDTKLSEDVRARLYALSEVANEWEEWVQEWRELNAPLKSLVDGRAAPDANEEYRLYQVLLGAWPLNGEPDDTFRQRIQENFRKAVSEAKRNTTWIHPNEPWLEAGDRFIAALLDPRRSGRFLESFRSKAQRIAHLGMVNSLTQVVLKLTAPGIPDIYQGNEVWDFSLVDPDNRRPVDYARRQELLRNVDGRAPRELLRDWADGGIKLRVTRDVLRFRRDHRELFDRGAYQPLETEGRFANHVVAFSRGSGNQRLVVIVPRLIAKLGCPPLGLVWDDTRVLGEFDELTDLLTGRRIERATPLFARELLNELPFAILRS